MSLSSLYEKACIVSIFEGPKFERNKEMEIKNGSDRWGRKEGRDGWMDG